MQSRGTCGIPAVTHTYTARNHCHNFSQNQSRLINLPEPCDKKIRAVRFS